ncbi:protease II [Luteibacter sp. HA06]
MRDLVPRLLAASLFAACSAHAAAANPPPTPKHVVAETLAGQPVNDAYRWLENPDAADVTTWIDAQNAYTESTIGAMPLGKTLSARIRELAITSTTRSSPTLAGGTLFYFENTPPQPQPVLVAKAWPDGPTRTLVDLNQGEGNTAITEYWPSPSGRYLAYGTAEGGSELTTIHILDTTNGKALGDVLPLAGGGTTPQALAWDADEKGVTYARFEAPKAEPAAARIRRRTGSSHHRRARHEGPHRLRQGLLACRRVHPARRQRRQVGRVARQRRRWRPGRGLPARRQGCFRPRARS